MGAIVTESADLGPRKSDLLLVIRGLAAISVVYWHTQGYRGSLPKVLNVPGRISVWIFFGISGYVIARGFLENRYRLKPRSIACYLRNRALRILPLFWLVSIAGWAWSTLATGTSPIGRENFASELLALQWSQSYLLNGVFWTLGIEMQFYVVAPLLAWLLIPGSHLLRPAVFLALLALTLGWPLVHARVLGGPTDVRNLLHNLDIFMFGMLGAALVPWFYKNRRMVGVFSFGAMAALLVGNLLYHKNLAAFLEWRGRLVIGVGVLLLVGAHVGLEHKVIGFPGWRILTWLGTLSYGIYAWHGLLLIHSPYLETRFFVTAAASVALAGLSYALLERPLLGLKAYPPNSRATMP